MLVLRDAVIKKARALFLSLLFLSQPSWATFSVVSHKSGCGGGGGAGNVASIDITSADLVIVHMSCGDSTTNFTDLLGNSWTRLITGNAGGGTSNLFYSIPTSKGTTNFSTACSFPTFNVLALSGGNQSSQPDGTNYEGSGSAQSQPGAMTPSADNYIWVSAMNWNNSGTTETVTTANWTSDGMSDHYPDGTSLNCTNYGGTIAWHIQTTATSENPTWAVAAALTSAIFKVAAGGAVTVVYPGIIGGGSSTIIH